MEPVPSFAGPAPGLPQPYWVSNSPATPGHLRPGLYPARSAPYPEGTDRHHAWCQQAGSC